jgi:hypothetical protein
MAVVRVLTWNIEIYGPAKFGIRPNNLRLASLISRLIQEQNATIVVLMELISNVALQIAHTIQFDLQAATGVPWNSFVTQARPAGDHESYAFIWRGDAGVNFQQIAGAEGLSSLQFPNNFSNTNGRRAGFCVFRTTDTGNNFAVSIYHAPPNARAIVGIEQLARTPELYSVTRLGILENVQHLALAGDYNLDPVLNPNDFLPLTNALPGAPPPNLAAGQGAGCVLGNPGGAVGWSTHVGTIDEAINAWGPFVAGWPVNTLSYRGGNSSWDNIAYAAGAFNNATVLDVVSLFRNPPVGSQIRGIADTFVRFFADGVTPAFPNAQYFPVNMATALNSTAWCFLLYRYAISDHLPFLIDVTI